MAVININYDEGNKEDLGYKSVELSYNSLKDEKIFNSGNFVKDWFDCIKFCLQNIPDDNYPVVHSSSVNHFIMDGAPYDSAYLTTDDSKEKPYLSYDNIEGVEHFVPKGTQPTWDELKKMCK